MTPPEPVSLGSSFAEFLRAEHPDVLHARLAQRVVDSVDVGVVHATTVLAMRWADGIVMAGDRRATVGLSIESRSIDKVFRADDHSCVAIAGAAGPALEMVRLFQVELEHYEKIEGRRLSLDGKANRLAEMIRQNLPAALQGFGVVPLFAGYDLHRDVGRIYKYDMTGGRYEEGDFHATGSGGRDARSLVKARWRRDMTRDEAVSLALEALFEAADEDAGTGGPDLMRRIYPSVAVVDEVGFSYVGEDEIADVFATTLDRLRERFDG
jgi:proteasome beta subunit